MEPDRQDCLDRLRDLHDRILRCVTADRSYATRPVDGAGTHDFAFAPDLDAERVVDEFAREWAAAAGPLRVVTEESVRVYPEKARPEEVRLRLIVDPIDGTRVFLRDLRPAWTLSAVAVEPPPGEAPPTLRDAVVALQSEIPTRKQDIAETMYTLGDGRPVIERHDVRRYRPIDAHPLALPADGETDHAFVIFNKFFPEGKGLLASIEEDILERVGRESGTGDSERSATDPTASGTSRIFEDQYLSTGGQFHCLATGRYAMVADLRPFLFDIRRKRGLSTGIACHPYDVATLNIALEAGVEVTNLDGTDFDSPMQNDLDVGFIAYAGADVRARLEPAVRAVLDEVAEREGCRP